MIEKNLRFKIWGRFMNTIKFPPKVIASVEEVNTSSRLSGWHVSASHPEIEGVGYEEKGMTLC